MFLLLKISNCLVSALKAKKWQLKMSAKIEIGRQAVVSSVSDLKLALSLSLSLSLSFSLSLFWHNHRSRETRVNLLFQFAPEKLGRFENTTKIYIFSKLAIFPIRPIAKLVRSPVVYDNHQHTSYTPPTHKHTTTYKSFHRLNNSTVQTGTEKYKQTKSGLNL